jgi:hypothetical protein
MLCNVIITIGKPINEKDVIKCKTKNTTPSKQFQNLNEKWQKQRQNLYP